MGGNTMDGKNKVAVLGASDNPDRYSNMLIKRLRGKGHEVFPINPGLAAIDGLPVFRALGDLPPGIDVLSVYMNASRSDCLGRCHRGKRHPAGDFQPRRRERRLWPGASRTRAWKWNTPVPWSSPASANYRTGPAGSQLI